jgi:hypothetical protein
MLQILAHADLLHELVLITVHTSKLTDVSEGELQTVGKLESIDITESILYVQIDDELRQSQNLTNEMERISETRLLSLFCSECLDWLQIHVVIEMKVIQILSVN